MPREALQEGSIQITVPKQVRQSGVLTNVDARVWRHRASEFLYAGKPLPKQANKGIGGVFTHMGFTGEEVGEFLTHLQTEDVAGKYRISRAEADILRRRIGLGVADGERIFDSKLSGEGKLARKYVGYLEAKVLLAVATVDSSGLECHGKIQKQLSRHRIRPDVSEDEGKYIAWLSKRFLSPEQKEQIYGNRNPLATDVAKVGWHWLVCQWQSVFQRAFELKHAVDEGCFTRRGGIVNGMEDAVEQHAISTEERKALQPYLRETTGKPELTQDELAYLQLRTRPDTEAGESMWLTESEIATRLGKRVKEVESISRCAHNRILGIINNIIPLHAITNPQEYIKAPASELARQGLEIALVYRLDDREVDDRRSANRLQERIRLVEKYKDPSQIPARLLLLHRLKARKSEGKRGAEATCSLVQVPHDKLARELIRQYGGMRKIPALTLIANRLSRYEDTGYRVVGELPLSQYPKALASFYDNIRRTPDWILDEHGLKLEVRYRNEFDPERERQQQLVIAERELGIVDLSTATEVETMGSRRVRQKIRTGREYRRRTSRERVTEAVGAPPTGDEVEEAEPVPQPEAEARAPKDVEAPSTAAPAAIPAATPAETPAAPPPPAEVKVEDGTTAPVEAEVIEEAEPPAPVEPPPPSPPRFALPPASVVEKPRHQQLAEALGIQIREPVAGLDALAPEEFESVLSRAPAHSSQLREYFEGRPGGERERRALDMAVVGALTLGRTRERVVREGGMDVRALLSVCPQDRITRAFDLVSSAGFSPTFRESLSSHLGDSCSLTLDELGQNPVLLQVHGREFVNAVEAVIPAEIDRVGTMSHHQIKDMLTGMNRPHKGDDVRRFEEREPQRLERVLDSFHETLGPETIRRCRIDALGVVLENREKLSQTTTLSEDSGALRARYDKVRDLMTSTIRKGLDGLRDRDSSLRKRREELELEAEIAREEAAAEHKSELWREGWEKDLGERTTLNHLLIPELGPKTKLAPKVLGLKGISVGVFDEGKDLIRAVGILKRGTSEDVQKSLCAQLDRELKAYGDGSSLMESDLPRLASNRVLAYDVAAGEENLTLWPVGCKYNTFTGAKIPDALELEYMRIEDGFIEIARMIYPGLDAKIKEMRELGE